MCVADSKQYAGFGTLLVDTGAHWAFTAGNSLSAGATMTNDGGVTLGSATLGVYALAGSGIVDLGIGGTLDVASTLAAGQSVAMGGHDDLMLGDNFAAYGTIGGFDASDTIDLTAQAFNVADTLTLLAGNVLKVQPPGAGPSADPFYVNLDPADSFAGATFGLRSDGASGTDIILVVPTVTSVIASPSSTTLGVGGTATFTLAMSGAVTVTGAPTLLLNDGGIATFNAAASTTTGLVFSYTAQAGQDTPDLAATGVALNGATIHDGGGQAANLSGAVANPAGILEVDTVPAPTLSLDPASDSGVAGDRVTNHATPTFDGTGIAVQLGSGHRCRRDGDRPVHVHQRPGRWQRRHLRLQGRHGSHQPLRLCSVVCTDRGHRRQHGRWSQRRHQGNLAWCHQPDRWLAQLRRLLIRSAHCRAGDGCRMAEPPWSDVAPGADQGRGEP